MRFVVATALTLLLGVFSSAEESGPLGFEVGFREGRGMVCPIAPRIALTAWHVAVKHKIIEDDVPRFLLAEINHQPVTLIVVMTDLRRDLAVVGILEEGVEFPAEMTYQVSTGRPNLGDRVWVLGPRESLKAKIIRQNAGYMEYDKSPGPGSSGGCVLTEDFKLVAVNAYMISDFRITGGGSVVWGPWLEIPPHLAETPRRVPVSEK